MGILEELDEATNKPIVYYHKFITSYKKTANDLYLFCEGIPDLSYYAEQIERLYPGEVIHKFPAECKNNVLQIWSYIDWDEFSTNRVLFFVDRDLSYWANEPQTYGPNVYITDGYSFENDAVSPYMFLKLLEDLYGFANCCSDEKTGLRDLYAEKWNSFVEGSYDLMGYILFKYQDSHKHTAQNIDVRKCLEYENNNIWKSVIKGQTKENFIRSKLEIDQEEKVGIQEYKTRFLEESEHYSIRGKWCLEFMIGLMDFVLEKGDQYAPSLYNKVTQKPKKLVDFTERGAIATIAPRIVPKESLIRFLTSNIGSKK